MKDQINKLKIVISFFKVALIAGFCFAVVNSIMNLLSEETGIANSIDKYDVLEKIPMPAFTIQPFDMDTLFKYQYQPLQLQSKMSNGKEFPSWFKPHGELAKFADETYLKKNFNLSWYDVWSINAKVLKGGYYVEESSFSQWITFNPPNGGFFEGVSNFRKLIKISI